MKDNKTNVFVKKLLTLVMPIAFQQFMLALVSASDAIMLGVLTQDALSAVSLASQITFVENLIFSGNDHRTFHACGTVLGQKR